MDAHISSFLSKAGEVLDKNWTGSFTQPAQALYPHQWSWDSAFIAIGYAHYKQDRAEKELRRLFNAQWSNGMVPQIVFDDVREKSSYFPGPGFWQTDKLNKAPDDYATSGICQPPIHATAVRHLVETAPNRKQAQAFAEEIFPSLKAWHDFLYRERDPADESLVYIRHPWSSGQDNSPNWDPILKRINPDQNQIPAYTRTDKDQVEAAERPTNTDYDRYIYLVDFFRKRGYDEEKIRKDGCPFMVQDVLFNSLLCRAGRDLAQLAEWLGKNPDPFQRQARKTAWAVNNKLWDDGHGIYIDYDMVADQRIDIHMISGFMPFFADIPSPRQAEQMFDYLNTKSFCRLSTDCLAVPSYDRRKPQYSSKKYWRGPIWINMNWMLYKGLGRYGHIEYKQRIKKTIIKLIEQNGFYEYYNPETGEGYGIKDFAWSASLFIDIIRSEQY